MHYFTKAPLPLHSLLAQHISWASNVNADIESQAVKDCSDCMLYPKIKKTFGPQDVDLFMCTGI